RGYSMKPVSIWVSLGMSLFLTLNSEAQPPITIDGVRQQLPPMGSPPANPLPVPRLSTTPPKSTPPALVVNPARQSTQSLSVPPPLPPGGIGDGFLSQNPLDPATVNGVDFLTNITTDDRFDGSSLVGGN